MIQYLEIKNFENHEHAIFKDFAPDFNLICGPSDSGKSSVIRAIKVVAFNEFDHLCVRTGSKFCEILIKTERGTVYAKRGKTVNEWEVTKNGQKKQEYKAVGKDVLDDAAEVIGLKFIKFNDMEVKVNVMDQLESHFMMASIEGKNASGSMRAQIIDEISGLSGIEPLIKEVSLDSMRHKKEVTVLTDSNQELISKLYPEDELKKEEEILNKANKLIEESELKNTQSKEMFNFNESYESVSASRDSLKHELGKLLPESSILEAKDHASNHNVLVLKINALSSYKNQVQQIVIKNKNISIELKALKKTEEPNSLIETAQISLSDIKDMSSYASNHLSLLDSIKGKEAILNGLPDSSKASSHIKELDQKITAAKEMNTAYNTFSLLKSSVLRKKQELEKIPDVSEIEDVLVDIEENNKKLEFLQSINEEISSVNDKIEIAENKLSELEETYHKLEKENQDILNEFDVCPFCDREMEKSK